MKLSLQLPLLFVACSLPLVAGCAAWSPQNLFGTNLAGPPAQTYEERKAEAVQSFELKREQAGIQAAVSTWERGDVEKAQAKLQSIVASSPKSVTARLRLAEIMASQNESSAAETHLRECLTLAPQNAEAQHALGMLLSDWPGREAEGRPFLQRACELDPQNAVYAAVLQDQ
ncbi:hypothetical protein ETAA8_38840 [Anatilimnocola aggregata]|uniref:Uncharacterized protein n=1 Tax=Anatilimnocola aggregata TaxID=2528021 RepID=A0A517YEX9_9BACT|nr:tetratricopeptide repeat protein [Anatilimnocola aggregata]QDU28779.1 hypothetical protein ETAA8_38840 [Anatilimnocola aggregata]